MKFRDQTWAAAAVAVVLLLGCSREVSNTPPTLYLIRHAEAAVDGSRNPPLSPAGQTRATCWAAHLSDHGITRIFSSDYQRTRQTAATLAQQLGLPVESYDAGAIDDFAARLEAMSGTILVVGHSNTTPELAAALGANPGPPIDHHEHGRLYAIAGDTARIHQGLCDPG